MRGHLRFSVVVTCYNYRAYVGEAIRSVLAQTWPASEVIVVDDGSTDGSGDFLEESYRGDARVRLMRKSNGGQLSAFRLGAAAAHGDVVCFLDADDTWSPGYLETLAAAYGADPAPDMVFANLSFMDAPESRWSPEVVDRRLGISALNAYFNERWEGCPSSGISLRLAWAQRIMALPAAFDPDWRTRADDVLVYGAAILGAERQQMAQALVHYRRHGHNAWLGRASSPSQHFGYLLRRRVLIDHYAALAGLREAHRRYAKYEFRTKALPTWQDCRNYCRIIWNAKDIGVLKRLEICLSIAWNSR